MPRGSGLSTTGNNPKRETEVRAPSAAPSWMALSRAAQLGRVPESRLEHSGFSVLGSGEQRGKLRQWLPGPLVVSGPRHPRPRSPLPQVRLHRGGQHRRVRGRLAAAAPPGLTLGAPRGRRPGRPAGSPGRARVPGKLGQVGHAGSPWAGGPPLTPARPAEPVAGRGGRGSRLLAALPPRHP